MTQILNNNQSLFSENLSFDSYQDFINLWNKFRRLSYKKDKNNNYIILNSATADGEENKRDIALMRSLDKVNIFIPADNIEKEYLLKIAEGLSPANNLSYFRIPKSTATVVYQENHFKKEAGLKKYDGCPEIIYISKNLEAYLEIILISCGPILVNVLLAAKELEKNNFRVTVLNMSTLISNQENIQKNIQNFFLNFTVLGYHHNILTIEEHSKNGGLGSIICELLSLQKNLKIDRLGLEDNLTIENIIIKGEGLVSL